MATRSYSARLSIPRWKPAAAAAGGERRRTPCESTPVSPNISPLPRWPAMRIPIDEEHMKRVIKKFPRTKWADLAAYRLIDNKLCGEWEAQAQCPEKEAEIYRKYADEHSQSPKAAEALYKAAWRYSALIVIYQTDNQPKKADDSGARAISVAKKLISQYPNDEDWSNRAARLIYMVQNKIPTFGNNIE